MRRGSRFVFVLAVASLSAGSVDTLAQNARRPEPAPVGQQAPPPAAAPDPRRMQQLLKAWEQRSAQIKTLDVKIRRVDESKKWGKDVFEGRAILQSPNLAWLNFDKAVIDEKTKTEVLQPHERIVCTGKEVWQYRSDVKQIFIFPLERQQQKRALEEGPLPFLFNMKAAEAEARYEMSLVNETKEYFVISVVPRLKIDTESFSKAFLRLNKSTFMPDRIFLLSPNGKDSKDFTLSEIHPNKPVAAQNFQCKPLGPPWVVVRDPGDQQAAPAAAPGIGNRPAQPAAGGNPSRRR